MNKQIVLGEGEGEKLWFLGGGVHTWKATAAQTGGAFFLFEDTLVKGKTTPLHRHADHDELLYVIDGEILVHGADGQRKVGRGGIVINPRGVEHAFCVLSDSARILALQTPGSGETFYKEASMPLPDSGDGPVDFKRLGEIAKATGTEFLGPPPFKR